MKKIITLVLGIFLIGFLANAQLKLGGKVGLNISRWIYENDSDDDVLFVIGYHGGGIAVLELPFGLEIESGLLLCQKGVSYDNFFFEGIKFTATPTYLDIPLKLNLKAELGSVELFLGAGPTFSYGIFGEYIVEGDGDSSTDDIKWHDEGNLLSLNRVDWGLGVQAGLRFSNIQLSGYYERGMANIFYNDQSSEIKNLVIGVSLTYFR
jgi:hypothetical protein